MNGLAWLNDLMLWLGKWFPRLLLIKAEHVGVKFGRAGRVEGLSPGLYCYWPIVTAITVVSVRRRTTEIAAQLIGREVVSIAVGFRIIDPPSTLLWADDVFSLIDDRAQAALTRAYQSETSNADVCASVLSALRTEFNHQGTEVLTVDVIQRGRVIPLKNLNDWAQHAKAEL